MKRIIAIISMMILFTGAANAQRMAPGNFNSLDISFFYEVTLVKGNTCSVTIDAPEALERYLDVRVMGNTLHLDVDYTRKAKSTKSGPIKATVTMPELVSVEISGSSKLNITSGEFSTDEKVSIDLSGASVVSGLNISSPEISVETSGASTLRNSSLFAPIIDLDLSGASKVEITSTGPAFGELNIDTSGATKATLYDVSSQVVMLDASGSSVINISGDSVTSLDIDCSGASMVNAGGLDAMSVNVDASGASKVDVSVLSSLEADASGASKIYYTPRGDLMHIGRSVHGAGVITKR